MQTRSNARTAASVGLDRYLKAQLQDLIAMGQKDALDDVGFRSKSAAVRWFVSRGGIVKHLPYRGRPKAFVVELQGLLPQLWIKITEPEDVWREAFRRYLRKYHKINVRSLGVYGFAVDHSYPRIAGILEEVRFTRLSLVDMTVNSSWGNWEQNFVLNDTRKNKRSSVLQISQMLKLSGFAGPKLPVTEEYIARAASYLLKHGLVDDSNSNFYQALRYYLHSGSHVPGIFSSMQDRERAAASMVARKMCEAPISNVPGWNYGYTA